MYPSSNIHSEVIRSRNDILEVITVMKKKVLTVIILSLFVVSVFAGCSKNDEITHRRPVGEGGVVTVKPDGTTTIVVPPLNQKK